MYIGKLDGIVDKYNNTHPITIKINPTGANSSTYIGFNVENNDENSKCKDDDHGRISK